MSNAVVKVVRIHYRHPGLEVDTLKGVGYRAIEGAEWRGPIRSSFRDARDDARERNATKVSA